MLINLLAAGSFLLGSLATPVEKEDKKNEWKSTKATYYGMPYDDGRDRKMANGEIYKSNGMTCATGLAPLGSKIEIKSNNISIIVKVTDLQAPKYRHLIDLPTETWKLFKKEQKIGKLAVEWRLIEAPPKPKPKTKKRKK